MKLFWVLLMCLCAMSSVCTCLGVQDEEKNYLMTGYSVPYQMQISNMGSCYVSFTNCFIAVLIFILDSKLDFEFQFG